MVWGSNPSERTTDSRKRQSEPSVEEQSSCPLWKAVVDGPDRSVTA